MSAIHRDKLEKALDALPDLYPGPGGVAGAVLEGEVIAARAWGYANLAFRRPMTVSTRLPICSISKQFTCGVLLGRINDPARLDSRVASYLPAFEGRLPTIRQLCDNQSGLRDYWALTVLHGAHADQTFAREDALPLIARMQTGHFEPGTSYSYCNCNFRIVSEIIESETRKPLDQLYRDTIWGPAGMETAVLTSDTRWPADDVVGYEGNDDAGYFPADNGIFWIGDAGISASLEDMLAYERWIDATREDPDSLYQRLSVAPAFADGAPASYGYGLVHEKVAGVPVTGHAGALRGFRAQRMHAAAERLSVVVIFNHEADFHGAAAGLVMAALGHHAPAPAQMPRGWDGQWICDETGLLARLASDATGATLRYATFPDRLTAQADGSLAGPGVRIERDGAGLTMRRDAENRTLSLTPLPVTASADGTEIAGRYSSSELDASMLVEARDGGVYAGFDGMLGQGPMERMQPAGADTWILATRRSMDAPAPGDWTFRVERDAEGSVAGASLGCWLARGIRYRKSQ